jgi:phenylalanyl-tRNA synthetase alpha chain
MLSEDLKAVKIELENALNTIVNTEQLDAFRLKYLVKKGIIQSLFDRLKELSPQDKPAFGKELNDIRQFAQNEYERLKNELTKSKEQLSEIDLTLPGKPKSVGTLHPINQIMDEMIDIFIGMGFSVAIGPDIEDEYHNFDALNFPKDHPARDMQDTFFLETDDKLLLRTHTSPVQIRVMKAVKPPIRSIMPGRVYRNEAINARSLAEFHQIEGLYVDESVTFAQLKGTMIAFARKMYGRDSRYRFRPSFFPFTEPSAEMDISCFLCSGEGCRVCKYSGWLEIAGCGMVHPNVLAECGIDPEIYSGFAFGAGIERVAMLRTGIDDIRLFYQNDVRVLSQF